MSSNVTADVDPIAKSMAFVNTVIDNCAWGLIKAVNFLPVLLLAVAKIWLGIRFIDVLARFVERRLEMVRFPPHGKSLTFLRPGSEGRSALSVFACHGGDSSGEDSEQSTPREGGYSFLCNGAEKHKSDGYRSIPPVLLHFAVSSVRMTLKLLLIISLASMSGFNTLDVIALLSAFAFSVGLATKSLFSDVARGIILILFRPYDEGDLVEVRGVLGKVSQVSILETHLTTLDSRTVFVPNHLVQTITNYYAGDSLREDVKFKISNVDDLAAAKCALLRVAKEHERVLQDPAPQVLVAEQTDIGIELWIRLHVRATDFIPVPFSVREQGLLALHAQGIQLAKGLLLDSKKTS